MKDTINILHLITRLPTGGAERLLVSILRQLDHTRFRSIVCCIEEGGDLAGEIEALGIPLIILGRKKKGHDRSIVPSLCDLIKTHDIDLVHSHLYRANLYGRLAAKRCGVPAIASIHNTYTKPKWHRRLMNWWLSRYTAKIIAGSDEVRRDIERYDWVPARLIETLPNCIDLRRVETRLSRSEARQRLGFDDQHIVLGTVGRLEKQKGQIFLLRAFARLVNAADFPAGRHLRLIIVGDGRERETLQEAAVTLDIADKVAFLGTRQDTADLFKAMDLYVMSSLWEGLSLAKLEAMAANLPVIVSDVGGAAEVLGDNEFGLRVPPGNAEALASAIRRLIENPDLRADLADKGRQRVVSGYSSEVLMQRLQTLYQTTVVPYPGKIAFVTTNLRGGGAEKAVIKLASALGAAGHTVHVILLEHIIEHAPTGKFFLHALTPPQQAAYKGFIGKHLTARKLRHQIASLTQDAPFDLIVSTLPFSDEVVALARLPRVWYRIANTLSAEIELLRQHKSGKGARRLARYRKLYDGRNLIAVSKGVANDLRHTLGLSRANIACIYNPFDFAAIQQLAELPDADIPNEPYVIHVGRFAPQKRHDLLLQAWQQSGIPHRLVLLTEPSAALQALIGDQRVTIAGFRRTPCPWMKHADLLILSSDHEGLPNVLIEALACGTPVVSTDCPSGPREVMTGPLQDFLVPPGDVAALAAAIRTAIMHPPELSTLNLQAFDVRTIMQQYEQLPHQWRAET